MQALARLSVHRPVVAMVLILVLVVVGGMSYSKLGVDRFPDIDFPFITISTTLPGATPEEIDTQVTEEIEKQVNSVSGIDTLTSTSSEGISVVMIKFVLEKDSEEAANEVRAKVDMALRNLPADVDKPIIQKMDTGSIAVVTVALSAQSASMRELTEFADKRFRPQLENISGVGQVDIIGGQARQINVGLDAYALRAYDLSASDVEAALASQNLQVPGGALDEGHRRVSVRTQGRTTDLASLRDLIVSHKDGQPIRLDDVADVEDAEEEAESIANVNGERAVLLNVTKQSGANAVAVAEAVKERVKLAEGILPSGYETRIVSDGSTFIKSSLHAVQEHLILGAILASLVVLLFLSNWRSAIIAAVSIPASLIATFTLMSLMGFSLNIITLLALTLAVGIVIDDAVIVLENIYRYLHEKKMSARQAALDATQEIGLAVLATTFSLIAVFVPIAFMSGIIGRFFQSFGLTMAFAILVSLLVAFTLTPMLCSKWLRRPKQLDAGPVSEPHVGAAHHSAKRGLFGRVEGFYGTVLDWSLRHRWVIITMAVLVFLSIVPLGKMMKVNFIPSDDQSRFVVSVRAPEGTSLSSTEDLMNRIAKDIRKLPEVTYTVVTVADDRQRTQNRGSVDVHMNEVEDRKTRTTQDELMTRTRKEILTRYPRELRSTVSEVSAIGGGASAQVTYTITGPELKNVMAAGDRIVSELKKTSLVADADTSAVIGKPELGVTVDRDAASDLGLSVAGVATTLRTLVAGKKVSDYAEAGQLYDINLRAQPQYRDSAEDLSLFTARSSDPAIGAVTLDQVVSYAETGAPSLVDRYARTHAITVSANSAPGVSEQELQNKVAEIFKQQKLDTLYRGFFTGRSAELGRTMGAFLMALVLATIFMYLILAAQFESWIYPLVILNVLPLTLPFALFSLVVMNGSLNIFSMLGMLVLFGVVMKNAILQVDHTNGLRAHGMERKQAILTACKDRLRPILMTTIAFVAGMIPLAISSGTGAGTNRAMSHVIIGGQVLSLAVTLIATPVIYSLADDALRVAARLRKRFVRHHEEEQAA
ncbi:MAG: efflux RND transporter permease subunit [Armatimonadota bacterium]